MSAGLSGSGAALGAQRDESSVKILRDSTFTALDRLIRLCLGAKADFLVLAGDVYNSGDSSLRARLALGKAFAELGRAGIRVFLAHGNHDPYAGPDAAMPWPDNVTVFGPEAACFPVERGGAEIARVCGVSHASERESRNLAKLLRACAEAGLAETGGAGPADARGAGSEAENGAAATGSSGADLSGGGATYLAPAASASAGAARDAGRVFQAGVLHCALAGNSAGHEPYAPCTLGDLKDTGLDYLAMGHVHGTRVFQLATDGRSRVAAYPGSLQGLCPNEAGQRGCLIVRVDGDGRAHPVFAPLAPVVWEDLEFCLEPIAGGPGCAAAPDGQGYAGDAGGAARAMSGGVFAEPAADIPALCASLVEMLTASAGPGIGGPGESCGFDRFSGMGREADFSPRLRLITIRLTGATALDSMLRKPGALEDLRAHLSEMLPADAVIRKIKLETRPFRDLPAVAARADLVGEIARLMEAAASGNEADRAVLDEVAVDLPGFFNSDKVRRKAALPDEAELRELVRQAGYLCLDLLEDD